jgi:hypothetical protein
MSKIDDDSPSSSGNSSSIHLTLQEHVYNKECLDKGLVLCPTRYADAIDHATEWNHTHKEKNDCLYATVDATATGSEGVKKTSTTVTVSFAPPDDVQCSGRALIMRQYVNMECTSGLGYGTWLVLCHLPISPLDPMVILLDANVIPPNKENDSNEEEDESDDDSSRQSSLKMQDRGLRRALSIVLDLLRQDQTPLQKLLWLP